MLLLYIMKSPLMLKSFIICFLNLQIVLTFGKIMVFYWLSLLTMTYTLPGGAITLSLINIPWIISKNSWMALRQTSGFDFNLSTSLSKHIFQVFIFTSMSFSSLGLRKMFIVFLIILVILEFRLILSMNSK